MKIRLRHYQAEGKPAFIKYVRKNPGKHPLLAYPTGSGKTFVIADIVRYVTRMWKTKVLVLSHVKEILEQNEASLTKYLGKPVSVNSAMMNRREVGEVTVAGIHSVYKNPDLFKEFGLIIVDEAHLIPPDEDTMYRKFFAGMKQAVVCGFTATPFRLGTGYIYGKEAMFDDLIVDWTTRDKYNQLIEEGWLCPLVTKRTAMEMDTSGIKLVGGDFSEKELSNKFDRKAVTEQAVKEIMAAGKERKKWLIFAIDIDHAEHIAETLIRNGVPTAPVHSKMGNYGFQRDKTIEGSRNGLYKCLVNVNILTTGYDDTGVDLIAVLRPTQSPVLHVQIAGRGSRIEEGKRNCLVLDFAGNVSRLGPVNDVLVRVKGKGKEGGDPITKTCPECESILAPAVRVCPDCGYKFPIQHGLSATSSDFEIIESGKDRWLRVDEVKYEYMQKIGSPNMIKVSYKCGPKWINEWLCLEHKGFAKHKADHWVKFRGGEPCKDCVDFMNQKDIIKKPSKIRVSKSNKYMIIKESKF